MSTNGLGGLGVCVGGGGGGDLRPPSPLIHVGAISCSKARSSQIALVIRLLFLVYSSSSS